MTRLVTETLSSNLSSRVCTVVSQSLCFILAVLGFFFVAFLPLAMRVYISSYTCSLWHSKSLYSDLILTSSSPLHSPSHHH